MPAWATVIITLGAAAIAVLGTLGATMLQHRYARAERERLEQTARRERAAAALGPLRALLADLEPDGIAVNVSETSHVLVQSLQTRWLPLRDALAEFAAADGDPAIV